MSIIKVQKKGQVTLPNALRQQVGIADGDLLEVKLHRGTVVLTPKQLIDRSNFPTADDEYTSAQRRVIDAHLSESEKDLKKGRTYGPFKNADDMIASMKTELKKRAAAKKAKRSR